MRILFLAALLLTPMLARGQGFNTMSGRNHPELAWMEAETEHFLIHYPKRLAGIEIEAAPVAEATYAALSQNLGVTFDRKIRIYLSDEDEIVNGFAVPISDPYTNIWVHVNEAADVFTGREKWLRKVLPHELTHIFHYQAVKGQLGWFGNIVAEPVPRFWTEGLSQYETEKWDAERGDRWLRTAVLDDRLSYSDGLSAWNGRLLYAVGNAQVRFFAHTYGDTTLAKMLTHRDRFLGFKVHDFQKAFKETTGDTYRQFREDWRRHVNIYYNTIAGQLEPADSLGVDPLGTNDDYLYDLQYSPDTSLVAIVSLQSLERPVRKLTVVNRETKRGHTVAEGPVNAPVGWSPDSRRLVYSRTHRGRHGAMLNDLYIVDADGRHRRQLTKDRRAFSPTFAPDGNRVAFVASEGWTANLFVLDLETGVERPLTHFTGDVQITSARWHPAQERIAAAFFDADGARSIVEIDALTGEVTTLVSDGEDSRLPVWNPAGNALAFTSRRDRVPNVFVYNFSADSVRRVTALATGATAYSWIPPDSARAHGSLAVVANSSKTRDRAFRIDAARSVAEPLVEVPEGYAEWTEHTPPAQVPRVIEPDASLVQRRDRYRSFRNITHAATFALPYYDNTDDFGVVGTSVWMEPLGKHLLAFIGGISFAQPWERSLFLASYTNNQWSPSVTLSLYRMPSTGRIYGSDLLVENVGGGDVSLSLPLDWLDLPFASTTVESRLRYVDVDPLDLGAFKATSDELAVPQSGQQADLRLSITQRRQRPYRYAVIHPLDGWGWRAEVLGSARVLGADTRFVRGDVSAYRILPSILEHRLFAYGRAQWQEGSSFSQDFVGLSRYDDIQIALPGAVPFSFGASERVRGYREYVLGDRMLFGSAEYRIPLLPTLATRMLGFINLGATSVAAFSDAALVWTGAEYDQAERRVGAGVELKNALGLGFFEICHALGIAQPAGRIGTDRDYEVYYRIRAAVPF